MPLAIISFSANRSF